MTFASFPRAFEGTLTNLQGIEICTYGAKDTNINIWVTLKVAQNIFYFSKWFVNVVVNNFNLDTHGKVLCY